MASLSNIVLFVMIGHHLWRDVTIAIENVTMLQKVTHGNIVSKITFLSNKGYRTPNRLPIIVHCLPFKLYGRIKMHKASWIGPLLCLFVMFVASNTSIAEDEDQPSLTDVRCYFEHTLLPELFYSDPLTVIGGMDSDSLYRSWNMIGQDFGYADSYAESDFQAYRLRSEKDIMFVRCDQAVHYCSVS